MEAHRLAQKLNLSAVFETSAKDNSQIDDAFFRSIVNCVDSNPDAPVRARGKVTKGRGTTGGAGKLH